MNKKLKIQKNQLYELNNNCMIMIFIYKLIHIIGLLNY